MSYQIDPEQYEIRELKKVASWSGKDVLEIGCGDGRLARRLSSLGASVAATDPDNQLVKSGLDDTPRSAGQGIGYTVCDGRQLPFAAEAFDIVVFGWSL